MSDASFAGIARGAPGYGTTCRQDVLRGVEVPVMPDAAERAVQHRLLLRAGIGPAPVRRPYHHRIAHITEKALQASRACPNTLLSPRFAGYRIPPRPEGRSILRRSW